MRRLRDGDLFAGDRQDAAKRLEMAEQIIRGLREGRDLRGLDRKTLDLLTTWAGLS